MKRGELIEEQIYQIVDGLLQMVGVKEMRDLAAFRFVDGDEAVGGDCARAGGAAGVRSLRRTHDDGRSADGAVARRPDQAAEDFN